MNNIYHLAKHILSFDEGFSQKPYQDTKGNWTIGIGHLVGKKLQELCLTKNCVDQMFRDDYEIHAIGAENTIGKEVFERLSDARKVALISMCWTLGERGLREFENMIEAIKKEDWDKAASEAMKSKWASDVDPRNRPNIGRDDRIAYMLREGVFPEEYKVKNVFL